MSTAREHDLTGSNNPAASSKLVCAPTIEPPPRQLLPVDLQLEIAARSDDVATVVRCAAASKPLRRAILDPDFRRRLALRSTANDGFNPALLMAVSYQLGHHGSVVVQPSRRLRFDTSLLRSFEPASFRDGILVLCRDMVLRNGPGMGDELDVELRVCNTFTGHVTSLPRMDLAQDCGAQGIHRPTLLTVDGASRSFQLLVMEEMLFIDQHFRTQTFSSEEGEWGDVRKVHLPQGHRRISATSAAPVFIRRTVHWLCLSALEPASHRNHELIILALQANAAQSTAIELPQGCLTSMESCTRLVSPAEGLILAAIAEGTRLSLVVGEILEISMWTLSPDGGANRWSRQVVIRRREIDRQLTAGPEAFRRIRFVGFGERSGTVLFWIDRVGLVQLNLATKNALVLRRCSDRDNIDAVLAFLTEIDPVSLLQGMKRF